MLTDLSIRNIVLISELDLSFKDGLSVLTGETGAGKSILLDALGLSLGSRAEARLVRHGANQAQVSAVFDVQDDPPVADLLLEHGIDAGDELILRRSLNADGKSRAFINDAPVSVGLLRQLGGLLVEIQGQFDQHGLMDPATHRALLDAFGDLDAPAEKTRSAFAAWSAARQALTDAEQAAEASRQNQDYLQFAVQKLDELDPQTGEEDALAAERSLLRNAGRIAETVESVGALLGNGGADDLLGQAARKLEAAQEQAEGLFADALAAVDRAAIETREAMDLLSRTAGQADASGDRLEQVEERLFGLREAARRHGVAPDELPNVYVSLSEQLSLIEHGEEHLAALRETVDEKRTLYIERADALRAARKRAAKRLDKAVNVELPPLKLEKAQFETALKDLQEADWGPHGRDRVQFLVATNPGAPAGPLGKIASGGERSRFLLALKVTLAERGGSPTLIFDEVDSGVGGATAAAVGERLERLATEKQILVVTHSPQVAAAGRFHWRVEKQAGSKATTTAVAKLDKPARMEEIARMLSGATITEEARAAAARLLEEPAAQ